MGDPDRAPVALFGAGSLAKQEFTNQELSRGAAYGR